MNPLIATLHEFERYLEAVRLPILRKFNPGIDKTYLEQVVATPILPSDVYTLYGWKNGTMDLDADELGKRWFFNLGMFISLEQANDVYRSLVNKLEKWDSTKFPLFVSGAGEFHLIDCDSVSSTHNMIYLHSYNDIEFDVLITKYDSLHSFFASVLTCYQENAYRFDDGGYFHFDFEAEYRICSRLNPRSDYWKLYVK